MDGSISRVYPQTVNSGVQQGQIVQLNPNGSVSVHKGFGLVQLTPSLVDGNIPDAADFKGSGSGNGGGGGNISDLSDDILNIVELNELVPQVIDFPAFQSGSEPNGLDWRPEESQITALETVRRYVTSQDSSVPVQESFTFFGASFRGAFRFNKQPGYGGSGGGSFGTTGVVEFPEQTTSIDTTNIGCVFGLMDSRQRVIWAKPFIKTDYNAGTSFLCTVASLSYHQETDSLAVAINVEKVNRESSDSGFTTAGFVGETRNWAQTNLIVYKTVFSQTPQEPPLYHKVLVARNVSSGSSATSFDVKSLHMASALPPFEDNRTGINVTDLVICGHFRGTIATRETKQSTDPVTNRPVTVVDVRNLASVTSNNTYSPSSAYVARMNLATGVWVWFNEFYGGGNPTTNSMYVQKGKSQLLVGGNYKSFLYNDNPLKVPYTPAIPFSQPSAPVVNAPSTSNQLVRIQTTSKHTLNYDGWISFVDVVTGKTKMLQTVGDLGGPSSSNTPIKNTNYLTVNGVYCEELQDNDPNSPSYAVYVCGTYSGSFVIPSAARYSEVSSDGTQQNLTGYICKQTRKLNNSTRTEGVYVINWLRNLTQNFQSPADSRSVSLDSNANTNFIAVSGYTVSSISRTSFNAPLGSALSINSNVKNEYEDGMFFNTSFATSTLGIARWHNKRTGSRVGAYATTSNPSAFKVIRFVPNSNQIYVLGGYIDTRTINPTSSTQNPVRAFVRRVRNTRLPEFVGADSENVVQDFGGRDESSSGPVISSVIATSATTQSSFSNSDLSRPVIGVVKQIIACPSNSFEKCVDVALGGLIGGFINLTPGSHYFHDPASNKLVQNNKRARDAEFVGIAVSRDTILR